MTRPGSGPREPHPGPRSAAASTTALKALRVLESVAAEGGSSSLADIASRADMDRSTTYRMLSTLVVAGYVRQDLVGRRYALTYRVVSLSRNLLADDEVFRRARRVLERLSGETGETSHLTVLDGSEAVLVQKVKGTQLVAVDFQIGDRSPLHATSVGKALLAHQATHAVEEVIARGLPRLAVNTIVEPEALRRELHHVRERGYAMDDHELADTMRCIAAPVFERDGSVRMGVSISGPDSRFTFEYLERLRGPVLAAARELSEQVGGLPPQG